jgi:hypothetical protein
VTHFSLKEVYRRFGEKYLSNSMSPFSTGQREISVECFLIFRFLDGAQRHEERTFRWEDEGVSYVKNSGLNFSSAVGE